MSTLRLLSLCTGIGGIDYAWSHLLGQSIIGQVELDPYCCAVLTRQWPNVPRYPDLKELTDADPFAEADLVAGGIPCQPYSLAGKRRGTADDRHLWPFAFALIARRRPTWVLIENVAGFISVALDVVQADLESSGYQTQTYVLPACALGAPHLRERCFVVAHTAGPRREKQQESADQPHPSGMLANANSRGWQTSWQQASASVQCSPHVADPDSDRQWFRQDQQECERPRGGTSHVSPDGTQGAMADADPQRLPIWNGSTGSAWASPSSDRCASGKPQSRMGRSLDGFSNGLDQHQWPAGPGQAQHDWEPPRAVTASVPYRAARLRALGNAIVPAQVYPILAAIVAIEARRDI